MNQPLLSVNNLTHLYAPGKGFSDVSFDLWPGEVLGIVGESGSGKTTLARILLGFEQADSGQVIIDDIDATALSREARRQLRHKIQFVYQNPFASLDPRQTLFDIIEEPLKNFSRLGKAQRKLRVETVAQRVALPVEFLTRTARELSGGQRQRVAIARALILEPQILLLDEPTSALDASVQAEVLNLLEDLRQRRNLTFIMVSHDLAVVTHLCERLMVMQRGQTVEVLASSDLAAHRVTEPYTLSLMQASSGFQRASGAG